MQLLLYKTYKTVLVHIDISAQPVIKCLLPLRAKIYEIPLEMQAKYACWDSLSKMLANTYIPFVI